MRSSAILLDKSSRFMILIRRVKPDRTYYVLSGGDCVIIMTGA